MATTHEVIVAGFGGQGVLLTGTILAYAGMREGKRVSWMPSYGVEMRGGTANCSVVVSEEAVASPIITEPTAVLALNQPSLDKFESWVVPGGVLIVNTSLCHQPTKRTDLRVIRVPANEIATEIGSDRVANMVMLGAFVEATHAISMESIVESLKKAIPPRRHNLLPVNETALSRGAALARQ